MGNLTRYEQETQINFNEAEDTASVFTHNKALRRKLEQLAQERPEECRLVKISRWGEAAEFHIPKSWLKIRPPRVLTDEQRAAMAESARRRFLGQNSQAISGVQDPVSAGEGNYIPQPLEGEKPAIDAGEEAQNEIL